MGSNLSANEDKRLAENVQVLKMFGSLLWMDYEFYSNFNKGFVIILIPNNGKYLVI